jgi:predicted  nucleic acid-binding Zn-ribbon protein
MKDWRAIADSIIQANSKLTKEGVLCLDANALSIGIAHALEMAANPVNIAEHDPWMHRHANKLADFDIRIGALEEQAKSRQVLVNDKWLEHLNNKLAGIQQRMNDLDGRTRQVEKRADEHRRLIDDVDKRLVATEQSAFASRDYITRLEAGAKDTVEKFKAMRGDI